MASAVLASRNETTWGQSFMGKIPYSNPHRNLNPNPKPKKPNSKKKHFNNNHPIDGRQLSTKNGPSPQAASDDAYSFNQTTIQTNGNGFNHGGYVSYNVAAYSHTELKELRAKLGKELERIRNLTDRIESGQLINPRSVSNSQGKVKKLSGNKRPVPFGSSNSKDPIATKKLHPAPLDNNGTVSENESLMKMCKQVLTKLMKHKMSWIFNKPVDAAALGLHDYHQIVKSPMDLGTVKSKLGKNLYYSPFDFAADVRLTFNNAMLYNPKTDEVHGMSDLLLSQFEDFFRPIQSKIGGQNSVMLQQQRPRNFVAVSDELQGSSWDDIRTPDRPKSLKSSPVPQPVLVKHNHSSTSNPPSVQSPVPTPSPVRAQPVNPTAVVKQQVVGKLPKPRAKDPNKRDMSMEEKQKLGLGLQSLPQEKMPQLVQIIRKRNEHLAQEGDEIELDIEALDTETLWELDRFVTNWKKFVSKTKRQALMVNNSSAAVFNVDMVEEVHVSERVEAPKKSKKEAGEEDVDIGDEMPESSFPPVEIEKEDDGGQSAPHRNENASGSSSSSSSSSSDSSSSDSDSGSSSGSDSDADEAQS